MPNIFINLTFWTAIGAAGSIGALLFIYYQIRTARRASAYTFLRAEKEKFRATRMLYYRSELAKLVLSRKPVEEWRHSAKHIANYFEALGLMLREGLVPGEFIWEGLSSKVFLYWNVLHPYVDNARHEHQDNYLFNRFEQLYLYMVKLEKRKRGATPPPTSIEINNFLWNELHIKSREYSPKDLEGVFRIEQSSFVGTEILTKDKIKKADVIGPDTFFVADRFGEIVGYVLGHIEPETTGQVTHEVARIDSIAVDSSYRNLGVGRALLRSILARFRERGAAECILRLHMENDLAWKLFIAEGFRVDMNTKVAQTKKYPDTACVTMRLALREKVPPKHTEEAAVARLEAALS
jgi:ribosomal protein S18 acetylase RimI-like enzyme